jgi:hypothetical protein
MVQFTCLANITVASIEYKDNKLKLMINYYESIEGMNASVKMILNSSFVVSTKPV